MQKFLFFLVLLPLSTLIARENPFFPVGSTTTLPITTNQTQNIPPLKSVNLKFPSTARVIKKVTVEYKNLDGSLATKSLELEDSIDWHLPIFISQKHETSSKKLVATKKSIKHNYKKVASLSFISFYTDAKQLKVITKDKLLRNFLLVKPHRIVCDFKHQRDIGSYVKDMHKSIPFKKIRIGTHDGYYRVVIELDGYYIYHVKKIKNGYIFNLR